MPLAAATLISKFGGPELVLGGGLAVISARQDAAVDDAAATAFFSQNGAEASALPAVAIVIAAYNEEGVVGSVVDALPNTVCGLDTMAIVVSDGSKDGTAEEAWAHGALVCDVPVNRGQGAALRLGYRLAREGGAQYIITTDADGQYNPAEMDAVLRPVTEGRADFVTGSRVLGSQETNNLLRLVTVAYAAMAISLLTGQRITDPWFGLRAMRTEVTGAVRLEQPQYQSSELLIAVLMHGFRVAEVPATIHKRKVGKSKKGHNAIYGLKYAGVVLGTWLRERRRRVPGSGGAVSSRGAAVGVSTGRTYRGESRDSSRKEHLWRWLGLTVGGTVLPFAIFALAYRLTAAHNPSLQTVLGRGELFIPSSIMNAEAIWILSYITLAGRSVWFPIMFATCGLAALGGAICYGVTAALDSAPRNRVHVTQAALQQLAKTVTVLSASEFLLALLIGTIGVTLLMLDRRGEGSIA